MRIIKIEKCALCPYLKVNCPQPGECYCKKSDIVIDILDVDVINVGCKLAEEK